MISGVFSIPLHAIAASTEGSPAPFQVGTVVERPPGSAVASQFLAGPENALVRVVAESVLGGTSLYNPIIIYGSTGAGKTALLHSLVELREPSQAATCLVTSGADFARAYANAVDADSLEDLRVRYDRCTLLVIDDLHRLASKPAAQQFLLHVFDRLVASGGLFVATLRSAPHETRGLMPSLVSRLSGGLVAPLVAPHAGVRRLLVEQIAAMHTIALPPALVERLANPPAALRTPFATAPQLRHAVLELASRAARQKRSLDAALFDELAAEHAPEAKAAIRQIAAAVAKLFQLPVAELKSKSRKQALVQARGVAMHLCRQLTSASFAAIGRAFGGRDHTTVMNACRRIEALLETDPAVRQQVAELMDQFLSSPTSGSESSGRRREA